MFEDSILQSKNKQGRSMMVSFLLQIFVVAVLILIPLIYTEALPKGSLTTLLVAPPPPPPPPPPPAAVPVKVIHVVSEIQNNQLRMPTKIPQKIQMVKEDTAPAEAPDSGVIGGVGGAGGAVGGIIGGIISSTPMATVRAAAPQRVRVSSGVAQGQLLSKTQPAYPPLARQARIQGSVLLSAIIGKDGTIQNLKVLSGHPMLTQSALDAVKQWRYKPYLLNGEPVEVETQVQVNFTLAGG